MIVIPAQELRERITALFCAAESPEPAAQRVAESLVENNLAGHDSHGVMMAPPYVRRIQDGYLNPRGEIRVVRESASTALLDCGFTFGQVAAKHGAELAMSKAAEHDLGMVVLRQCNHVGRLGEYVNADCGARLRGPDDLQRALAAGECDPLWRAGPGAGNQPPGLGYPQQDVPHRGRLCHVGLRLGQDRRGHGQGRARPRRADRGQARAAGNGPKCPERRRLFAALWWAQGVRAGRRRRAARWRVERCGADYAAGKRGRTRGRC